MSSTVKSGESDYQLNTLTDMVSIVGETRSDVKALDRKVDCNQQENRERFDRLDKEVADMKNEITGVKNEVTGVKSEITGVKSEITGVKSEITGVKNEVTGLKNDMTGVKKEITDIKETLRLILSKLSEQ